MQKISAPRGFADILPAESRHWQSIERTAREVAELYHFAEIRTPVLEFSDLFHRGVGETSDVVRKETFTFVDRGGDSLTLRPEGTAGVVRAVIEGNLIAQEGSRLKVFYIGANFRHERPQRGRLRQHHQFGAEAFGIAEPAQDVECILLQMDFYRRAGLRDLSLQINSLGDSDSKARYRQALVDFLRPRAASLSADSQRRLEENPLRILDSKDPADRAAIEGAPPAGESLSDKSRAHFAEVQRLLGEAACEFVISPSLVRGFDYYTETLWEVTAAGLGSQNAIGGGGRYDNLVQSLGGRATPGVGFGSGLERLLIALEEQKVVLKTNAAPLVWLVAQSDPARNENWRLLAELRQAGIAADMDLSDRSVKAQFKQANNNRAAICITLGDSELASGSAAVKDLQTGQQATIARLQLIEHLRQALAGK